MIFLVGTFPPPVHGMSAINQALYDRLVAERRAVKKLDTAPRSLKRDVFSRLSRLGRVVSAWSAFFGTASGKDVLYLSAAGGWGQVYDVVTIMIARLRRLRCIIHHHNFSYLHRWRWLSALLFRVAGENAVHIVLCEQMRRVLSEKYALHRILVVSNIAFYPPTPQAMPRGRLCTLGFLSNITSEKGGRMVLDLAVAIREQAIRLDVVLAGPCLEQDLTQELDRAASQGILEWRGSVYGEQKLRFWQDIDVFVFPTQYPNEAEPIVIFEALAAGVPVITYQRGCIADQVGAAGILVPTHVDFVQKALEVLQRWHLNQGEFQSIARAALLRYQMMWGEGTSQWSSLLGFLEQQAGAGEKN